MASRNGSRMHDSIPPESINITHGDEGSENDISSGQQTVAQIQGQGETESNIINAFVLKEEIAAHSLILSALAGHVQENISHFVPQPSRRDTSCHQTASSLQNLSSENSQNYLQNHNGDGSSHLSFRVSPEIEVQLIAIQQAADAENTNKNNGVGDENDLLHTQNTSSYDGEAVQHLAHLHQHEQENEAVQHLADLHQHEQENEAVVNLNTIDAEAVKIENVDPECNVGYQTSEPVVVNKHANIGEGSAMVSPHLPNDENETINDANIISRKQNENNNCPSRLFVANSANEAHDIIKSYAEETMSTFVSMRKMKQFGVTDGGIDLKKKKYRVFFESCDVEFDGIPYVYVADKMYICHLGKDKTEVTRQKIRQQSMERRLRMGLSVKDCSATRLRTKKIDCPVKITVKMIAKFPQYQVLRKTKRVCETASKKVRHALIETNGQLRCYYLFVGKLPAVSEHNHPVGEETAVNEPIDPLIKDKIIELTWEGAQSSNDVRKRLDEYVTQDLFAGKTPPAKTRRRYHPNVKDIRNYMNKAKMLSRLSPDIRSELQTLGRKFQTSHSGENIVIQSDVLDDTQEALLQIKTCEDEDGAPKSSLIFCHQTSQQQRLLKRYGNQFILCEVTNLLQRVPFPLFCLLVQTNVDYQAVASFIVELRNKESLIQGLASVKEWNPTWTPKYVTVDYSDEQMEAVKAVFPGSTLFISDISRERNWRQWLAKAETEIRGNSQVVFEQFQGIAHAYNEEELHNAALQLENSEIWAEAATLRSWFNSNWLLEAKKWVVGYRPDDFFVARHNEMGIEADLLALRDAHINFARSKKLSSFIEHLVDVIIPDFYKRYVDLNRKSYSQANELKVLYGDQLPACLINRPAAVILYVLNQIKSTESTVFQVSHVQPGVFWVQDASTSTTKQAYTVSFGDAVNLPSCDCLDWQHFKLPCKHLCSVFTSFSDWGWDMMNSSYTSHPIINLDHSCIRPWIQMEEKEPADEKLLKDTFTYKNLNDYTDYDSGNEPADEDNNFTSSTMTDVRIDVSNKNEIECESDNSVVSESDVNAANENNEQDNGERENNSVFVLNVNTDDVPSLSSLTESRRNEIALQCHNLLRNLSQLSASVNFVKDESFERLKSDLQASIGVLKTEAEKQTSSDQEAYCAEEEKVITTGNECFEESTVIESSYKRKTYSTDDEKYIVKKQKACGNQVSTTCGNQVSSTGLVVDDAMVSDDEELNSFAINDDDNIEEETVETEIVSEAENNDLPRHSAYEYSATKVETRRVDTFELTAEQRERQLLAILTANTN